MRNRSRFPIHAFSCPTRCFASAAILLLCCAPFVLAGRKVSVTSFWVLGARIFQSQSRLSMITTHSTSRYRTRTSPAVGCSSSLLFFQASGLAPAAMHSVLSLSDALAARSRSSSSIPRHDAAVSLGRTRQFACKWISLSTLARAEFQGGFCG